MQDFVLMNEWTVSGRVFYMRELEGEFAGSLKLSGTSQREDCTSSQLLEFACLLEKKAWEEAKQKGIDKNKNVTLSGHIESWPKNKNCSDLRRIMFIADYILEVV